MISFRFLPSPWRLVTCSLVAASVRIRVVAHRPQRVVGLAVAAPVETMPYGLSR